ncbi:MAG: TonB-dependent receptor [Bacteroidaceae bacterium]|jgi:iron complex outermembrane receptor protein|nr:TonB-dependent receptor [Bacteroidaceae bacterium]
MRIRRYIYTLLLLLFTCAVKAQDDTHLYESALEAYEFGFFEKADSLLRDSVGIFKGENRISVFRLLALSNLNMDKPEVAETWVASLLSVDPYYRVYNDVPRFTEMVERLKSGKTATITTASQQAESLEEAPVPVTLITEEMIRMSGARNLKEALIAYVPGMSNIECNEEMNIAMRGVYASRQEKILIMLNGHRLNSYSTNVAAPDFSIGLEKVKQIEVLRGPASSLYGGVALTSVINIITKDAADVDGLKVKASKGNYGQMKGDLLFGKRYMNLSLLAWANIYKSDGQSFDVGYEDQPYALIPQPGTITIGAYNQRPTHDLGFTLQWKDLSFTYNNTFSKTVAPYSMSVMFTAYSYDRYGKFNGNKPGFATSSNYFDLKYDKGFGNWGLSASVTYDASNQQQYQVAGDDFSLLGYTLVPTATTDTIVVLSGAFQNHVWNESTIGGHLQGSFNKKWGKNDLVALLGAHAGRLNIEDSHYEEGDEFDRIIKVWDDSKNLMVNHEMNADVYFQLKYKWNNLFIVNAGIRYDYKNRYNYQDEKHEDINVFSPRVAFIMNIPRLTAKLSYSKSFVDAPYFYRNSKLDTSWGGGLKPEYLNSLQATLSSNDILKGLNAEVNVFYNMFNDLVVFNGAELAYFNGGKMKSWGTELAIHYTGKKFMAEANMTWQKVLEAELYENTIGDKMSNIPTLMSNVVLQYEALKGLKVHTHLCGTGIQKARTTNYFTNEITEHEIPSRVIVDLGVNYDIKNIGIGINLYNLLNKEYVQGGVSTGFIRQQGRWLMADISYTF